MDGERLNGLSGQKRDIPGSIFYNRFGDFLLEKTSRPCGAFACPEEGETGPMAETSLEIALIHMAVRYRRVTENRQRLIDLNREAAKASARIILNTEMGVSGYAFDSRKQVAPLTETQRGETIRELSKIAREYGVYIGVGLAERDEGTDIFYNSAFMLGPEGRTLSRYRKVNAELRWGCPGRPRQESVADTPWGRIGMLICSDSYYGLLPRTAALKGVDLLWVPANWPPGELDPMEIWRARAMENGYYLAAVNRTGKDRRMDCREACSCVFDPEGAMILAGACAESKIYTVSLPLDGKGKIKSRRELCLKGREPRYYENMYLNLRRIRDLTEFFELPPPGLLTVHSIVPEKEVMLPFQVEHMLEEVALKEGANLFLLPPMEKMAVELDNLSRLAKKRGIGIFTRYHDGSRDCFFLATPEGGKTYSSVKKGAFPTACYGPAKIAMFSYEAFSHPELAVSYAKQGCDIALLSEPLLNKEMALLAGVRTIENLAAGICAGNGAVVCATPRGYERWKGNVSWKPGIHAFTFNTARTRDKWFQDHVDFDLLLSREKPWEGHPATRKHP